MKKRTCSKCQEKKELCKDNFHKDVKNAQGFSCQCKVCKNGLKNEHKFVLPPKVEEVLKKHSKIPRKVSTPKKVVIVPEEIQEPYNVNTQALSKKLDSRFTITYNRQGEIENIQTHSGGYRASYRKESLQELLAKVL